MSTTIAHTKWNADLYDNKHQFVFKYGEDLLNLLEAKEGEHILDLGCGTGHLTNLIAQTGASVIGMDNSEEMIAKAKESFPDIPFSVQSATDFYFDEPFDAIFSNAVLHWVTEKEKAIDSMFQHLKKGGRLVAEFGGKGNVQNIIASLQNALQNHGYVKNASLHPWYFPSIGEYTTLLEQKGFRVNYAAHYDRETELADSDNGIKDWIKMFGSAFLQNIEATEVATILSEAQEQIFLTNFRNGKWYADYKRIRIIAIK